jgi:hypothetical protein
MDDLDKLAATRTHDPKPSPRSVREGRSKRVRSVAAWTLFTALLAFLPAPVFLAVVGGFATPLMVVAAAPEVVVVGGEMRMLGVLLAVAAIALYTLPCWGVTRLLVWAMRPLSDGAALLATLVVVAALFGAAHLPIFGLGHNSMPSHTAIELYREAFEGWRR